MTTRTSRFVLISLIITCSLALLYTTASATSATQDVGPVTPYEACPGAPKTQLVVGNMARVNRQETRVRVREQPNTETSTRILFYINPGEAVQIVEGPQCGDKVVWWRVMRFPDRGTGWAIEGDVDSYWILPPTARPSTATPRPTSSPTVPPNLTATNQAQIAARTAVVEARRLAVTQTAAARPTLTALAQRAATATRAALYQRLTAVASATNAVATSQAASLVATRQAFVVKQTQAVVATATAGARFAGYRFVRWGELRTSGREGQKVCVLGYVTSFKDNQVRVYTSADAPDHEIDIRLAEGVSTEGLRVTTSTAFTFYGVVSRRESDIPVIEQAFWGDYRSPCFS